MTRNDKGSATDGEPSAPANRAQKPANPDVLAVANGAAHVDIHEFVQQLMVSDKIMLDYLKQSEIKSGGSGPG